MKFQIECEIFEKFLGLSIGVLIAKRIDNHGQSAELLGLVREKEKEILQGIKDDMIYEIIKSYLLEFPIIKPKGKETYIAAAEIYRKCRRQGKTLRKTIDCIIASIVKENNLALLHKDNDFEVIKKVVDLKIVKVKY